MVFPIHLHHQSCGQATEIGDVPGERDLPPEPESRDALSTEDRPELPLGVRRLLPHDPRERQKSPVVVTSVRHRPTLFPSQLRDGHVASELSVCGICELYVTRTNPLPI